MFEITVVGWTVDLLRESRSDRKFKESLAYAGSRSLLLGLLHNILQINRVSNATPIVSYVSIN